MIIDNIAAAAGMKLPDGMLEDLALRAGMLTNGRLFWSEAQGGVIYEHLELYTKLLAVSITVAMAQAMHPSEPPAASNDPVH